MAEENVLVDLNAVRNRQRHYETIVIVSPALTDAIFKETLEKNVKVLTELKASILRQDDWGKKRMAYGIDKHSMGRYIYFRYIGTQEGVKALERSLKLDANILRYLTVRLSEPLSDAEIQDFVERAPKEPSAAPTVRGDDEDSNYESNYQS